MAKTSVILTVWEKSPHWPVLRDVIDGILSQKGDNRFWIWDNGYKPNVDWTQEYFDGAVKCSDNLGLATHQLAGMLDSEFILKIDDDIVLTDPEFINKGIAALEKRSLDIAGVMGRWFPSAPPYYINRGAIQNPSQTMLVDVVIGKVMLYRREILRHVSAVSDGSTVEDLQLNRASKKPGIVIEDWTGSWYDLVKTKSDSLSGSSSHYLTREDYVREHWHELRKLG